jgi:hypothetical protein
MRALAADDRELLLVDLLKIQHELLDHTHVVSPFPQVVAQAADCAL